LDDRDTGLCAAPESPHRLNDKCHCALGRPFVRKKQACVGRNDADQRQRRQIERLGGESGADQDLRATTTERVEDAVTRADR
jgi:hypothetical protein